jgi:hypothetical protein
MFGTAVPSVPDGIILADEGGAYQQPFFYFGAFFSSDGCFFTQLSVVLTDFNTNTAFLQY